MITEDFECKNQICRKIEKMRISYCLLSSFDSGGNVFSISVAVYENGKIADERFVFDISRSEEEAEKIFKLIYENYVTPYSLDECLDAVYDILSES